MVLFDGNSNQVAWIVPSEDLVILRVGDQPPRAPEWDNTAIPNTILRGIVRKPGEAAPPPQARPAG
jgi:CubicO group peptidase (beta-lactamase class C family)